MAAVKGKGENDMSDLPELQPDETVVLQINDVGIRKSPFGMHDELYLTSKALLLQKKNMFGKAKEVLRFPLDRIRVVNGEVQAKMGKKDIVTPTLDVYFEDGFQRFLFTWEKDVKEWIAAINAVVKGEPFEPKGEFDDMMQDMAKMAAFAERISDSVVGSVTRVKDALGIKSHEKVVLKCPSCGASLAGIRGETDICPYCGTCVKF